MKRLFVLLIAVCFASAAAYSQTNDFYDDAETVQLTKPMLEVKGEVANPGMVNFSGLPLHSVIVKETRLVNGADKFIGAYRYDGYSLYDILNTIVLKKKNEAEFPPIIDLYVEIENAKGEKAVFSWGELYYPTHRYEILIASQVARIVPSKTKELWDLPTENRLIVASDLLTERNISSPVKLTVKSYDGKLNIQKGLSPMYSQKFSLLSQNKALTTFSQLPTTLAKVKYPSVFYGRGRGIHGITPFDGYELKQLLLKYFPLSVENLQKGFFVINGKDGYHGIFTYSEVMNRNDQAEFLIVPMQKNSNAGAFRIFPAPDFFSDRAINSVESITFSF